MKPVKVWNSQATQLNSTNNPLGIENLKIK